MKRSTLIGIGATALLLLAAPPSTATPPKPVPTTRLKIDFSHPNPSAGSKIYYRIRFENTGFKPVRVPADLLGHLDLFGWHAMPWDKRRPVAPAARQTQRPVTVKWKTLQPDAFMEVRGSLKDVFKQCQTGCQSGDYHLLARLTYPGNPEVAGDETIDVVLPRDLRSDAKVSVTPHRMPVGAEAISMSLDGARQVDADTVELRATYRNISNVAVWVPRPHKLNVSCNTRVIVENDTRLRTLHHRKRAEKPWREAEGVMLAPGHSFSQALACNGLKLDDAISAYVKVRVRPAAVFFPTTVVSPYYLAGALKTGEVVIKRPVQTASK